MFAYILIDVAMWWNIQSDNFFICIVHNNFKSVAVEAQQLLIIINKIMTIEKRKKQKPQKN